MNNEVRPGLCYVLPTVASVLPANLYVGMRVLETTKNRRIMYWTGSAWICEPGQTVICANAAARPVAAECTIGLKIFQLDNKRAYWWTGSKFSSESFPGKWSDPYFGFVPTGSNSTGDLLRVKFPGLVGASAGWFTAKLIITAHNAGSSGVFEILVMGSRDNAQVWYSAASARVQNVIYGATANIKLGKTASGIPFVQVGVAGSGWYSWSDLAVAVTDVSYTASSSVGEEIEVDFVPSESGSTMVDASEY
jgi:hypothetical protein